ncbi:MAG: hypothetical protein A2Z20_04840 [Bdellovibrionales bacterium RBG_16_40_8]|nr:MAG: hypothetical protein A2Z20_04840 [Bdellovibrionales bacterium RBG_16_40_8]
MKNSKNFPFDKARRVTSGEVSSARRAIEKKTGVKRKSRGRPNKSSDDKFIPTSIRLHPKIIEWAKKEAKRRGCGYQTIINEILLEKDVANSIYSSLIGVMSVSDLFGGILGDTLLKNRRPVIWAGISYLIGCIFLGIAIQGIYTTLFFVALLSILIGEAIVSPHIYARFRDASGGAKTFTLPINYMVDHRPANIGTCTLHQRRPCHWRHHLRLHLKRDLGFRVRGVRTKMVRPA